MGVLHLSKKRRKIPCMQPRFLISTFMILSCLFSSAAAVAENIVVDSIVASIDGEPITLSDVFATVTNLNDLTLDQARENPEFKEALEKIIDEKLLYLEAEKYRVHVSAEEVDAYVSNLANHNNLSAEEFDQALKAEGKSLPTFKEEIKKEIVKSKLASNLIREGGAVSEQEITDYINDNYNGNVASTRKVKLRQIQIEAGEKRSAEEAKSISTSLHNKLIEGKNFIDLAKEFSDSPDASSGGELGLLAEEDLSPDIFNAIVTLREGEFTDVIESSSGFHIFLLEERFDSKKDIVSLREEVRKVLDQKKIEEKFQTYFISEIYRYHTVERKI